MSSAFSGFSVLPGFHRSVRRLIAGVTASFLALTFGSANAQQGDGTQETIKIQVLKPDKIEATTERIAQLKLPEDFVIHPFAMQLKNVRVIATTPDNRVFFTRRDQADLLMLEDLNADGRADGPARVVARRAGLHGIAIRDRRIYLVTVKELFAADLQPDGTLGSLKLLFGDLPDSGQHANRTIAFGPDGMLYLSVGSTCNACNESNPESATILRISPDGQQRTIFATGLRNTIGFDWELKTGEMWGFDHGIDFLGDDQQPEELNRIRRGSMYGWPHVFGERGINPQSTPVGGIEKEQWRAMSIPMAMGHTAHSAPMQMHFYTGSSFPADYQGDAFVTFRGSWNRDPPSGYEVARVRFRNGLPTSIEPFISGFLTDAGKTHFARPMGLAQMADGSLLVGDDANGVIYRVTYKGGSPATGAASPAPATAMLAQAAQGIGVSLALKRKETQSTGKLVVSSTGFAADGAIGTTHSEYYDGVSPPLQWSAVVGAKSYAIIVEDPDAKPTTPFVHWTAWNLATDQLSLPEGMAEQMRLTEPEGVLQGATSRGTVGYLGPRPPVGDAPHHYHFQVFALDTMLNVPPGAERDVLLGAMAGHVLAKGERVGTYQQKDKPLK